MTGYDPIELRKMMRTRLFLYGRAIGVKNKILKKQYTGDLKIQNNKIKEFLTSPFHQVDPYWKSRALKTIKSTMEKLR